MAEGSIDMFGDETECSMAIERVSQRISYIFPQYPEFPDKFKIHCREEAFEETDVLIDDVAEGFDESVILEAIAEDIHIIDDDKEPLCQAIHNLLSTFVPPQPGPSSLNLLDIYTNCTENDINAMKKLVSAQVKLLEPNNDNTSIYKVLNIGQQNNFPLLTYLVCSYQRFRLLEYFIFHSRYDSEGMYSKEGVYHNKNSVKYRKTPMFQDIKLQDFISCCSTMIDLQLNGQHETLLWYVDAMKSCIHRNGIFYIVPLEKSQITNRIHDSLTEFQTYFISLLLAVNNMLKQLLISYPTQIDVWIIPQNIKEIDYEDDVFVDAVNKEFNPQQALKYCDNLQQIDLSFNIDIRKLSLMFENIIKTVLNQQNHKRMCMVIDRRLHSPKIYAYLPKNTQNIPASHNNNAFLYESMLNLTKKEIFPSNNGEINANTINGNSDMFNMFVLSLHIHKEREVAMYWHYKGSTNRFCVYDMITIWPLQFILNVDEYDGGQLTNAYILNNCFDQLIDINFQAFYEINTKLSWLDSIAPFGYMYISKPKIIKELSADQLIREQKEKDDIQRWHQIQKNEARHRKAFLQQKAMAQNQRSNLNILKQKQKQNLQRGKISKFSEGDIKVGDELVDIFENDIEFKVNDNKEGELEFDYVADFDKNGLLYFLGTHAKRKCYANPALIAGVTVNASSLAMDSKRMHHFAGRKCVRCMTNNICPSWIKINIHPIYIKLSKYTLKHHNSHNAALLNWTLEGSNDGRKWMIMKNHIFDQSLRAPNDTHTWDINVNHYFSQFRIFMTDKNNSGRWYLGCSGIELYGQAFGGLVSASLMNDFFDEELLQEIEFEKKEKHKLEIDLDAVGFNMLKSSKTWNSLFKKSPKSPNKMTPKSPNKRTSTPKSPNRMTPKSKSQGSVHKRKKKVKNLKVKWNIYPKGCGGCVQNKGKVVQRSAGFNRVKGTTVFFKQFMFGSNCNINGGLNEFKIKYECLTYHEVDCLDAVGITSAIHECRCNDRWITNTMDDEKVNGIRYVYWGGGKIYCIGNYNEWKEIKITALKWKHGQILTVQIDCTNNEENCWYITFFLDDEKVNDRIRIEYTQNIKYYPIISTQCDDSKFTVVQ